MFSFLRVIRFAFQDMVRNMSLSLMTVLILILMLLSVNTVFVVDVLTKHAAASIKNKIDVSIYFDHTATEAQIAEVKTYVDSFPEVTEIIYYNRDEVLAQFREEHKENPDILASLDQLGDNPLGATMVVKVREPSDYKKIIDALNVPEYEKSIEAKTFANTEKAIDRIHTITTQVERFSLFLSAFFAAIAFIIIFNTIGVVIRDQRIEITIKKLVGATNWFIRSPYLVISLFFSILSVVITYTLMLATTRLLDPYIAMVFETDPFLTAYFKSHILMLGGIQFAVVLAITVASTMIAMRKHLRA